MNSPDPELSHCYEITGWYKSLEKDFLLECPKCHFVFPNTATLVFGKTSGQIKCRKCNQLIEWYERRSYVCEAVKDQP